MRRDNGGGVIDGAQVKELIRRNTYGGAGKHERREHQEIPVIATESGIKSEWEHKSKYPTYISVKMTDGQWVKYQIHTPQPGFQNGEEISRAPSRVIGYPPEKRK